MGIRIFHRDKPDLLLPMIASDARLIVWLGSGSHTANMNYVHMQRGERNVLHAHSESEDTIFILSGEGTVEDGTNGEIQEFAEGDVIHVPAGILHAVRADRGSRVESVGGPAPADREMLRNLGVDF